LFEKGLSFAEKTNHRATLGQVQFYYGIPLSWKGDGPKAIRILKNAIKDLEGSQTMIFLGITWAFLGFAHWLTGDYRSALESSEKGLKIHSGMPTRFYLSWFHCCYSLAHFSLGNLKEAVVQAEQALKCSLANNEKQHQGLSRIVLGRVLAKADPGQIEVAVGQIRQGISQLEELGILPWSGIGYFWLGEVYAECGPKDEAQENLKKAETMFREMGMDYWLVKAQEALARL